MLGRTLSTTRVEPTAKEKKLTEEKQLPAVVEWAAQERQIAEDHITRAMFNALLETTELLEKFSIWMLVAAGAVGSFMIGNAAAVTDALGRIGFISCGMLLVGSCAFGLAAKFLSVQLAMQKLMQKHIESTMLRHLAEYDNKVKEIEKSAKIQGIEVETEIRIDSATQRFFSFFPSIHRRISGYFLSKIEPDPLMAYVIPAKLYFIQGIAIFFQALLFLGFLGSGFIFAIP